MKRMQWFIVAAALAAVFTAADAQAAKRLSLVPAEEVPAPAQLVEVTHWEGAMGGFAGLYDPSCCAPAPKCCSHRHGLFRRRCRECCTPPPSIKQTLTFCHPCTGCKVHVDVCIPGCCTGPPRVCYRDTIIGCGMYTYEWCCGHTVKVRFLKCGDVRVRQHD